MTYKGLSSTKSIVLHDNLAMLVMSTYKNDFNISRWIAETLTEEKIKQWIEENKK